MNAATAIGVAAAGGLGSLARWAVASAWNRDAPWGTFAVNVLGALLIGAVIAVLEARGVAAGRWRAILASGFLGGFTTFSALALEAVVLIERRQWGWACLYVTGTAIAGLLACALGLWLGRRLGA